MNKAHLRLSPSVPPVAMTRSPLFPALKKPRTRSETCSRGPCRSLGSREKYIIPACTHDRRISRAAPRLLPEQKTRALRFFAKVYLPCTPLCRSQALWRERKRGHFEILYCNNDVSQTFLFSLRSKCNFSQD